MNRPALKEEIVNFKNLSPLNFALEADRNRMKKALDKVKLELGGFYRMGDGARLPSGGSDFHPSFNPANRQQVVGSLQFADSDQALQALNRLHEYSKEFRKSNIYDRVEKLLALSDWMEERRCDLAAWMVFEVGKTWKEADADVCEAIDFCRFYAQEALSLFVPRLTQAVSGETNHLIHQPRGVGLVIAPWNFPLAILTGMSVASWICGNTTIIKPAEQSGVIAAMLAQGMTEVGFPKDSYYFLPGVGEEIGPLLVQDERVDLIAFTGSAAVGLSIIEEAAKKPGAHQRGVKRVVCEMGGKNAIIVDEDADLDEAVTGCLYSAFGFQGQKCSALSRLLVHENVFEQFVHRFVEAVRSLKAGNPESPDFQIGPVVDEEAYNRIQKTISEAESRLNCLYKAENMPTEGYFVPPSIFLVEDIDDPIFQNEIFGPVVAIKKIHSLDEGFECVNSVKYALTGGIYSRSPSHIERAKWAMDVGNLYINRGITGAVVERQPFGGFKLSGIGSKAGGTEYLLQFVEPRTITENTVRRGFAGTPEA